MKIGITCYATYGGSGVLATELGKALAQKGHTIHFITNSIPIRLHSGFHQNIFFHQVEMTNYPLFGESKPYVLALASKMAEIFIEEKLDLLHVHYAIPHAIAAYLAQQIVAPHPMPIITTLHGTDITLVGKDPSYLGITKLGINKSTIVTAVSDYLKDQTEKFFQPQVPIQRIYNFVDTELFKPQTSQYQNCFEHQYSSDSKPNVFLHLSNFRKVKGAISVIKIFDRILKKNSNCHLLMVGEGPELNKCRQLAKELKIDPKICFLGNQSDIIDIINMADIVLCPSHEESFGLVPLEAMACEIPAIVSDIGGLPEVVIDNITGYVCPLDDIELMAKKALYLINNPEIRHQMGQAGRARAIQYFNKNHIVKQYEEIYFTLI